MDFAVMFKRRWLTIYFVSGLLLLSAAAVWAQAEGDTPDTKDAHLVIDEDEGAAPVAPQAPVALPETQPFRRRIDQLPDQQSQQRHQSKHKQDTFR